MQSLNLPVAALHLTRKNEQVFVRCLVRKKSVVLTPEEWVRQHLISFLFHQRNVPIGLVSVEKSIKVNGMTRRFDILVSDNSGQPSLLVECKAPEIAVNQEVFYQIAQYNSHIKAKYFLMSNGLIHYFGNLSYGKMEIGSLPQLPAFPAW